MSVNIGQIGNIFKRYITLTYGATVDWTVRATSGTWGVNAVLTLTGDATLNEPTGMSGDEEMVLLLKQDATGGRTLTFPSTFQFIGSPDHTEQPSGFDLIHIKYESSTGNFYCNYARTAFEKEQLITPGGSNVNLDMSAFTDQQVREYHGRTIYFNNLNSTGGGTLSTLVDLDQAWLGYKQKVIMRQSANGGALRVTAAKIADLLYVTGIDDFPFLDTTGTHFIELGDDHLYQLEFDLVVRDPSGTGATKFWSIQNVKYRFVGGVTGLTAAASVDWDLLTGTIKTFTPDQATTLTISNLDTQDFNLLTGVLHVTQGGAAYDIELPANSRISSTNIYLVDTGGTITIENMSASEEVSFFYYYDGTDFVWTEMPFNGTSTSTAYTDLTPSADPALNKAAHGNKIKMIPGAAFTLSIPTGYDEGEEIEILVEYGGTGYFIAPGAGWKTAGGSWIGSSANTIYSIRASYQGSSEWYARIDNSISTPV